MILGPFTTFRSTFLLSIQDGYLYLIKLNLKSSIKYSISKSDLPLFTGHIDKLKAQPIHKLLADHKIVKIDLKSNVKFELIKNLLVDIQLRFYFRNKEYRLTPDLGYSDYEIAYLSNALGNKMEDKRNE